MSYPSIKDSILTRYAVYHSNRHIPSQYGPSRASEYNKSQSERHNPLKKKKGRINAWKERRQLDGTCKTLQKYRKYYIKTGDLSHRQKEVIIERLKKFESISLWINDTTRNLFSDLRKQFNREVHLNEKAINKIQKQYGISIEMTSNEAYEFWKRVRFKNIHNYNEQYGKKPNYDCVTKLYCDGEYKRKNPRNRMQGLDTLNEYTFYPSNH
eukprot:366956_1